MGVWRESVDQWIARDLREVADEGVRLGIGAAIRRLDQLVAEEPTYDGRAALAEAIDELRQMSIAYAEPADPKGS